MQLLSRTILRLALVLGFLFSSVALARATSVTEVGFSDLVHQADVIAVGTVSDIREQWDAARKAPLTLVTFSRLTAVKGNPGAAMTLAFLGGHTPEGLILSIAGVPHFTVGEKNVVFSTGNRRDFCPLVGVWQGRLRVTTDPQRGIETVSDNFRVPIVKIHNNQFLRLTPGSRESLSLPLSDLLQQIRQQLSQR